MSVVGGGQSRRKKDTKTAGNGREKVTEPDKAFFPALLEGEKKKTARSGRRISHRSTMKGGSLFQLLFSLFLASRPASSQRCGSDPESGSPHFWSPEFRTCLPCKPCVVVLAPCTATADAVCGDARDAEEGEGDLGDGGGGVQRFSVG